ncbi:MAG TPA: RNHCP domain-containing protein [Chloroflexota bacterium]|nr:RNHCP domain-containing protein [Chloroflexota bacterium]
MSRTYRRSDRPAWSGDRHSYALTYRADTQEFRCRRCKMMVGPPLWGGSHRNHCPFCLYSRHVDGRTPGDRSSECGALMEPVGVFVKGKGEHVIVHRCLGCGFQRHNRVAGDDDFGLVVGLPALKPRVAK